MPRWIVSIFLLCVLAYLTSGQASAKTSEFYIPASQNQLQALDIYTFDEAKNAPVMVYIHGGAWSGGDKRQVGSKPAWFNAQGYIFVSINYRLLPAANVADQLSDIDNALGWINKNIEKYGGDGSNIHIMGHSAGAHLTCLSGIAPRKNIRAMIRSKSLRSVICNDTMAYDISAIANVRGGQLPAIYASVFSDDPVQWDRYSPQNKSPPKLPMPAFLLIHSGQRFALPRKNFTVGFAKYLRENNIEAQVFDAKKYSHRQVTVDMGKENGLTLSVSSFLNGLSP